MNVKRGATMTGLGALLLCAPMACSELDPLDDTCLDFDGMRCNPPTGEPDADLPPANDGPWDCLGNVQPRALPNPRPPGFAFIVPIVDFANPPTPPEGLVIQVCQINDFNCSQPVPAPQSLPDPTRPYIHQINLPFNFEGYLRLTARGYIQTEYYFLGPIIGGPNGADAIYGDGIGLPREDTIDNFFIQFGRGTPRLPNTALVAFRIFDCTNERPETQAQRAQGVLKRAAGVTLDLLNAEASPWTLIGGQPTASDPPIETDDRGLAGFANIEAPLSLGVEAVAPNGTRYGRTAVNVRPNQLTQANVRPNYSYGD